MVNPLNMVSLSELLETCAHEPIHIPGAIQPHGVLLTTAYDRPGEVQQVSTNVEQLLGFPVDQVLGSSLVDLFEPRSRSLLTRAMVDVSEASTPSAHRSRPIPLSIGGSFWDGLIHRHEGVLFVELEPMVVLSSDAVATEQALLRELSGRILAAESAAALHRVLPGPLRKITGYERVMIYLFDDTGDGAVVAEDCDEALEPYLGLRYPASDIPAEARRLYVNVPTRVIVDADYDPSLIVPVLRPDTGAPLDLSHSVLRSVSPVHCEYLHNMGVRGSMSISLIDRGRLFGLIAFHHRQPHLPRYELRDACASLARVAAFVHLARRREQTSAALERASLAVQRLVSQLGPDDIVSAASTPTSDPQAGIAQLLDLFDLHVLFDMVEADGAIVRFQNHTRLVGKTPPREFVDGLCEWLLGAAEHGIFVTNCLAQDYPPAAEHLDTACGVLAVTLAGTDGIVAWLRPEVIKTVSWGGNPHAPVEVDREGRLGPRRSFACWRERVSGRSIPFEPWQHEVAERLRHQLADLVLRHAAEINGLNVELRAALEARDDFLSIASHELKTPLSTLLLTIESLELGVLGIGGDDPRTARRLEIAKRQVVRLDRLVSGLLDVSRIHSGKLELDLHTQDLVATVHEVVERLAIVGTPITISGISSLICRFDRLRIDQVATNLISNAIKYAGVGAIEVVVDVRDGRALLVVRDRGPGIPPLLRARLFERFVRADEAPAASGLGLGLWIARAIVLAHAGEIRVETTLGGGTTMVVELPRAGPPGPIEGGS